MGSLKGKDILHGNQFSRKEIEAVMKVASEFEKQLKKKGVIPLMKGKLLATLFFEPSTRTRLSFETAIQRLGGGVIGLGSLEGSSVAKGETLVDTCRTVAQYADLIAIRHPKTGSAKEAADAVDIPVLNGGDGTGQHPTQALLDVYTIRKELKTLKNLTIAMVGDLKYGRTVHALVELLAHFNCKFYFVSPGALRMPEEITSNLRLRGIKVEETEDLRKAALESSVIYMTRIQRERFTDVTEYEKVKGAYIIDAAFLKNLGKDVTILHPLPRVNEINPDVDNYPGAAYFRQMRNGVFIRMALIAMVMGKK